MSTKTTFREFVQDLFPNPVIDKRIIEVVEKDLALDPIIKTCSFEIITLLTEIKVEIEDGKPRMEIILQDKFILSLILDVPDDFQIKCFEEYRHAYPADAEGGKNGI